MITELKTESAIKGLLAVFKKRKTFRFRETILISLVGLQESDGIETFLQEHYLIIDQGLGIGPIVVV